MASQFDLERSTSRQCQATRSPASSFRARIHDPEKFGRRPRAEFFNTIGPMLSKKSLSEPRTSPPIVPWLEVSGIFRFRRCEVSSLLQLRQTTVGADRTAEPPSF